MMLDALIKSFGACPREVQGSWECLSFCPSQLQLQSGYQVHVVNMYESHRGLLPEYLAIKNNFMNVMEIHQTNINISNSSSGSQSSLLEKQDGHGCDAKLEALRWQSTKQQIMSECF